MLPTLKKTSLCMLLAGIGADSIAYEPSAPSASRFVETFPDSIQGAREVEIYVPPNGYEHVLIHVAQRHLTPLKYKVMLNDDEPGRINKNNFGIRSKIGAEGPHVKSSTRDVSQIIFALTDFGVTQVYVEGFTEAQTTDLQNFPQIYQGLVTAYQQKIGELDEIQKELEEAGGVIGHIGFVTFPNQTLPVDPALRQNQLSYLFLSYQIESLSGSLSLFGSGAYRVALSHKVTLKPADDSRILDQSIDCLVKGNGMMGCRDLVFTQRENHFVRSLDRNSMVNVVVFGGEHDFRGVVGQWNQKNQSNQYALIVITPESY